MRKKIPFIILFFLFKPIILFSSLPSLLPEISSWKLSEPPKLFHPNNLYEHINGGAEAYLLFGFKELLVAYFEKNEATLTIEIYDMGNHYNSFGIYSIERSPENQFIQIGNQGYTDGENLFFITGPYYIKILCSGCGEEGQSFLLSIANSILEKLKDKGSLPEVLKFFPEKGLRKNSEKFFPSNFLGIDFLRNGFIADYELEGERFNLFIVEEKVETVEEVFEKFKDYLERRKGFERLQLESYIVLQAEDRVYGKISILKKGRFIIGYLGRGEFERVKNYFIEIIKRMGGWDDYKRF